MAQSEDCYVVNVQGYYEGHNAVVRVLCEDRAVANRLKDLVVNRGLGTSAAVAVEVAPVILGDDEQAAASAILADLASVLER